MGGDTLSRIKFLNTQVDNLSMIDALNKANELINNGKCNYVVTPNVDHIVNLERDYEFNKIYEKADLILTDGMPLIWISKVMANPIKEKISGSDFFPNLCKMCAEKGYSVFLLGAAEGVAGRAAKNLTAKYPGLNVVGTYSPSYGFEKKIDEIQKIIDNINQAKPDVLAVGVGSPKQEKFISNYLQELNVPLSLGIGATIDFEAGNLRRAPKWMQAFGLEWFYRLLKEPKRMFKRYLINDLKILYIIFKYRKR
jgi:N-acetylglucosaminyldiphosphoundecaprenol N-acetyl-beta-D-mannosaminyltransferase